MDGPFTYSQLDRKVQSGVAHDWATLAVEAGHPYNLIKAHEALITDPEAKYTVDGSSFDPVSRESFTKVCELLVEFVNTVARVGPDQVRDVARLTDSFDEEPGWPDLHTTYQKAALFLDKLGIETEEPNRNDDPEEESNDQEHGDVSRG